MSLELAVVDADVVSSLLRAGKPSQLEANSSRPLLMWSLVQIKLTASWASRESGHRNDCNSNRTKQAVHFRNDESCVIIYLTK